MSEYRNFHSGEATIQAESGIDTAKFDHDVDQPFQPELNDSEVRFVGGRTFSVAASLDQDRRPWASPLIGEAGSLFSVLDLTTVRVQPRRVDGDPLFGNVEANGSMGVLYFNPEIRRRAKSLGSGHVEPDGSITYRMHRMFGLCPKYIFKRSHDPSETNNNETDADAFQPTSAPSLTAEDRHQLERSDTIFLASHSEANGTDPTHRGGPPGFITVENDSTISMREYVGNGMFQTLGNLLLDDRIGLLDVDFGSGRILQLTGRGSVKPAEPNGVETERILRIEIDEVRVGFVVVGVWTNIEASPLVPS